MATKTAVAVGVPSVVGMVLGALVPPGMSVLAWLPIYLSFPEQTRLYRKYVPGGKRHSEWT